MFQGLPVGAEGLFLDSIICVGLSPLGHRVHAHSTGTPRTRGALAGDKGVSVGSSSDTHLVPGRVPDRGCCPETHHHTDKRSIALIGDGPHTPSQIRMLLN